MDFFKNQNLIDLFFFLVVSLFIHTLKGNADFLEPFKIYSI